MDLDGNRVVFYGALVLLAYLCWQGLFGVLPQRASKNKTLLLPKIELPEMVDVKVSRDPFDLSGDFLAVSQKGKVKGKKKQVVRFPYLRLDGILGTDSNMLVSINGEIHEVGESIKGAKILTIQPTKVVFDFHGKKYERNLHIPTLKDVGLVEGQG